MNFMLNFKDGHELLRCYYWIQNNIYSNCDTSSMRTVIEEIEEGGFRPNNVISAIQFLVSMDSKNDCIFFKLTWSNNIKYSSRSENNVCT